MPGELHTTPIMRRYKNDFILTADDCSPPRNLCIQRRRGTLPRQILIAPRGIAQYR